jgi:predicted nucleotidyltransferase
VASAARSDGEALLRLLPRWAQERRDIRALALVGSWVQRAPEADSDLDLILLTDRPALYTDDQNWVEELGGVRLVKTQLWGVIAERRFVMPSGLEVEVGVGRPSWASIGPLDEGTRRVATDGLRPLYDPLGLLVELLKACRLHGEHR